jgi:hypothetical protein
MSVDRERAAYELGTYPRFVTTDEQRQRFDLCLDRASEIFEEPREGADVRQHAIALYKSDIPTNAGNARDPNDPLAQSGEGGSRMGDEERQETRTEETETSTTTEETTSEPAGGEQSDGGEQGGGESSGSGGEDGA